MRDLSRELFTPQLPPIVEYNTIVIGASLSGSIVTTLLARRGQRVLLLDPMQFPRRKACGEGLSHIGYEYLNYLGLWSKELEETAQPFWGYDIHFGNGRAQKLVRSREGAAPLGYGVSRSLLDQSLQERALDLQTVTHIPERVSRVERLGGYWRVELSDGNAFHGKDLVFACGPAASKLLPSTEQEVGVKRRFGLVLWCEGEWRQTQPSTVMLHHRPEGEYLFTQISPREVNISVLLSKKSSHEVAPQEVQARALELLKEKGFRIESISSVRGASSIHHSQAVAGDYGAYQIGDALERFDPIGGLGMTHGVLSAVHAASMILRENGGSSAEFARAYKPIARSLRLLTTISFHLNVRRNRLVRWGVCCFPVVSMRLLSLLHHLIPAPARLLESLRYQETQKLAAKKHCSWSSRAAASLALKARVFQGIQ